MLKEATEDHAAAGMKLTRQNDGKLISMTDTAGNRTDFDFKDYSVSSSFAGPAGKTLVTRGKNDAFLLVDAASHTPLYRLIPGNPPKKIVSRTPVPK